MRADVLNGMNLSVDKSLDNSLATFKQSDKRERMMTSASGSNFKMHQTTLNQGHLRHGIGSEIVEDEAGELLESIEPILPGTG